jgi:hypothetical protein
MIPSVALEVLQQQQDCLNNLQVCEGALVMGGGSAMVFQCNTYIFE